VQRSHYRCICTVLILHGHGRQVLTSQGYKRQKIISSFFHQPYYLLTFSNKPSCVIWILIIFRWSESSYIMYYCHIKSCALTINHLIIIYGLLHFPVLSGDIYVHMYIYGPCIWPHNNIVQATSSTMHHVCLLHARKKRAGGQGRDRPWCAQLDSL
jgi:hypothetical protein